MHLGHCAIVECVGLRLFYLISIRVFYKFQIFCQYPKIKSSQKPQRDTKAQQAFEQFTFIVPMPQKDTLHPTTLTVERSAQEVEPFAEDCSDDGSEYEIRLLRFFQIELWFLYIPDIKTLRCFQGPG